MYFVFFVPKHRTRGERSSVYFEQYDSEESYMEFYKEKAKKYWNSASVSEEQTFDFITNSKFATYYPYKAGDEGSEHIWHCIQFVKAGIVPRRQELVECFQKVKKTLLKDS